MSGTTAVSTRSEFEVSTGLPIGKMGMWWFLSSEVMVFGGLIGIYVLFRMASAGAWAEMARHVSTGIATLNTMILLTSSLTMVLAFAAIGDEDRRKTRIHLALTVFLGLAFLGVKALEYATEIAHGFTPLSGNFWSFYYTMTGLHALHVLAGVIANSALLVSAVRGTLWPATRQRVEYCGLYWHFVDIVWIFLFPLLYLSY
ncbi:MAG: heme-copper oxidase subunit III [Acidobacteriota bacterium]